MNVVGTVIAQIFFVHYVKQSYQMCTCVAMVVTKLIWTSTSVAAAIRKADTRSILETKREHPKK